MHNNNNNSISYILFVVDERTFKIPLQFKMFYLEHHYFELFVTSNYIETIIISLSISFGSR